MLSSSGIILASETLAEMETEMEDHEKKCALHSNNGCPWAYSQRVPAEPRVALGNITGSNPVPRSCLGPCFCDPLY